MPAEIPSFQSLNNRLEHRTSDAELGFTRPPTEAGMKRYEFNREEISQRLEDLRREVGEFSFIGALCKEFPEAEIYLVGGAVRDAILGKKPKDFDFVIGGVDVDKLREFLAQHGRVKDVESREFGVFKFHPEKIPEGMELAEPLEIALPRSEKYRGGGGRRDVKTISDPNLPIEKDLARRDFTINAIALNLATSELVDPHDGVGDMEKGILRAVGDPEQRFNFEDPSRILRGLRFACTLGLDIEDATYQAMQKYVTEIWANTKTTEQTRVATETVAKEFLKGFHADPLRMIRLLRDTDALFMMMPELIDTIGVEQPPEVIREGISFQAHKYDVWGHILKALKTLPNDASINLQIATLFHDIAKPQVQQFLEDRIHFHKHELLSAEMARGICNRLRLSSAEKNGPYYVETGRVAWLVKNHMTLFKFNEMGKTTREKYLSGEQGLELLGLYRADILASSEDLTNYNLALDWREKVLMIKESAASKENVLPPLINGNEVMETLGIKPGPKVGEILTAVREAQLAGQIKTKEEAINFIRTI